jgi:hypothetical protein
MWLKLQRMLTKFATLLGHLNVEVLFLFIFGKRYAIQSIDIHRVEDTVKSGPRIILTRKKTHLSAFFVALGHFFLTGEWGYWSHLSLCIPDSGQTKWTMKVIESTSDGVRLSFLVDVMKADAVCVMRPRLVDGEMWGEMLAEAMAKLGVAYDDDFNLESDDEVSCVELLMAAAKQSFDFDRYFPGLSAMVAKEKNLTPDMIYTCGDFQIYYEARRNFFN